MTQEQIDFLFHNLGRVDEAEEYRQIQEAYAALKDWFETDDIPEANVKDISRKFLNIDPFSLSFAVQALVQDMGWEQDYIVISDDGTIHGRYRAIADIPDTTDPKQMAADINVIVVRKRNG
jgi:hypothetical protein